MRFKPTRELCYLAGVMDNWRADEKSYVGLRTKNGEIVERFVKYAVALGVDTRKIMIEQAGETQHAYFYHSRIARMIRDTLEKKTTLPGRNRELATCLAAGMFDSKGRVTDRGVYIGRLDRGDALMLENLGVRTSGTRILTIGVFLELVRKESVLAGSVHIEKAKRSD
jgi:hypothetical protein